jgi:cell division protein ZapA
MAEVSIVIRGRSYQISCEDGQEAQLIRLGQYLDKKAKTILSTSGSISDSMLLIMVALMIADELSEVAADLENLKADGKGASRIMAEEEVVNVIDTLVSRIDSLSERLEGP